jgi:hypothetical protein
MTAGKPRDLAKVRKCQRRIAEQQSSDPGTLAPAKGGITSRTSTIVARAPGMG